MDSMPSIQQNNSCVGLFSNGFSHCLAFNSITVFDKLWFKITIVDNTHFIHFKCTENVCDCDVIKLNVAL